MGISPLFKAFDRQIIPWVEQYGISKIALAQPSWRAWQAAREHSPDDIRAVAKPLLGKRKAIKGRRQYDNTALIDACWPEDHLQSTRAPMLVFILLGAVTFPVADYQLHCQSGYGILVPPGVAHSDGTYLYLDDSITNNTACDLLMLRPYNGGMECWLSHTRNGEHWSHRSSEECCRIPSNQAVFCLEMLNTEMISRSSRYQKICDGLLSVLVNLLGRELQQATQLQPATFLHHLKHGRPPVHFVDHDHIGPAQEYIRNHLSEQLSLEKVARHVYMSKRSFSNQFRQQTNQSFLEYLNNCRFEEACRLLELTDWSVERVGNFVGLRPSRLRTLFQQLLGISPSKFRRDKRNA